MENDFGITIDAPSAYDDACDWMLKPTFASRPVMDSGLPLGADESHQAIWDRMKAQDVLFITDMPLFGHEYARTSLQCMAALRRHPRLLPLYEKFPTHVPCILLMAELHFLMNDTHGALDLCQQALKILEESGEPRDPTLVHAVSMLEILAKEAEQWYEPDDPEVKYVTYERPFDWESRPVDEAGLLDVMERWEQLKAKENGALGFSTFANVKSNELEGVFLLECRSGEQLARYGLDANCIQGISKKSRIRHPETVISILKNAQKVFRKLELVANGELEFDDSFLKEQHAQVMEGNNLVREVDVYAGNEVSVQLLPMGMYRKVPCMVHHHRKEKAETHFCLPGHLQEELSWYFQQAERVLNDTDADPYRACAWLQHSYLKIHPFGDGNGRLGRMISSIPLIKAGLPPVYVSLERKHEYFDALMSVDEENDIDVLAKFLKAETIKGLTTLIEHVPSPISAKPRSWAHRAMQNGSTVLLTRHQQMRRLRKMRLSADKTAPDTTIPNKLPPHDEQTGL